MAMGYGDYGAGLGAAGTVLRSNAMSAGLDAPVPTCPGWTVRDLVVHQGVVHRWATDVIEGRGMGDGKDHEESGRKAADLLDWFDEGWAGVLHALGSAPADLEVPFFLRTGDSPLVGWARRQCHETVIHAVDAMAARLGRTPGGAELWFDAELATDGIDEVVRGFIPRKRIGKLRSAEPLTLLIEATDTEAAWTLMVSEEPTTTMIGGAGSPDVRIGGPARALYVALWNRGGDDAGIVDPAGFLAQWRRDVVIEWA